MKFGQFMLYYKQQFLPKSIWLGKYGLETSSRSFYVYKELRTTTIEITFLKRAAY